MSMDHCSQWILFLLVVLTTHTASFALLCYECYSTKNPDCGRYFRRDSIEPTACKSHETMCALQRQDEIPGEQVAAIVRGCFQPGQVGGLNTTDGCREWTNPSHGYTALYCFCSNDLCNAAMTSFPAALSTLLPIMLTTVLAISDPACGRLLGL